MAKTESFSQVIKNRGFLNLWVNQILVQLSYNALNFTLIIWVFRLTGSNTALSFLLFTIYLPAVIFGLFAGVFVDVTDRKKIILLMDFLLAVAFFSLIFIKESYPLILAMAFLVNSLAQFYIPAESSAIPLVVKRSQLMTANSIFATTLYVTFLLGFGSAGPLINHLGVDYTFGLGAALLITAFVLAWSFPRIVSKADEQGKKLKHALRLGRLQEIKQVGLSEILETIDLVRGKLPVLSSISILAGVQVVVAILAVIALPFLEKVLHISATDASQVLIVPLGLGMITGGFLIGKVGYIFARRRLVGKGILLAGLLFFLLGLIPLIFPIMQHLPDPRPLPFFYQLSLSKILFGGSFLLGIALVSVIVPSQTVLQENTPEEDRGKVFAVLGMTMAGLSLLPVLTVGVLSDVFGMIPIVLGLGVIIILIGMFTLKPSIFFSESSLPYNVREFLGLGHWKRN